MPAPGTDGKIRRLGVENEFWMINIAVGRSLWRLWDLCLSLCTSFWLSSPRSPPCLHWLISFLCKRTPQFHLPASLWSITLHSLLHGLIDGWTLTSYPSCILAWSARPLCLEASRALTLPIYSPYSSPSHPLCCSVHYSLCFPLDPELERAWLNSQADSTVCPRVPKQCESMHEWKKGKMKTDWRAEKSSDSSTKGESHRIRPSCWEIKGVHQCEMWALKCRWAQRFCFHKASSQLVTAWRSVMYHHILSRHCRRPSLTQLILC